MAVCSISTKQRNKDKETVYELGSVATAIIFDLWYVKQVQLKSQIKTAVFFLDHRK